MKNWERKSLGDVCEIVNGSTPLRTNKDFWENGNFPWFTIDDIREQGRIITDTKQKVTEAALSKLRVLPIDTVLLCCTASVGEYAIAKIELTTNQQFNGLVAKDRKKLDPEFLMHYCSTLKDKLLGLSGKTTIDFIAISKLKTLEIPLPPLPEQQRIVSILDECFAAIDKAKANAEQNLKNAKELFESYLQGVFENGNQNWKVNYLDELGTITSSKRIYKSEYVKNGVPFYRTKEIKELSNGKPITLELFISRERYEQIKQSFGVPKIGDLLMSAVGTIGEIMVIENEDEFYFKDGNIVWFKDFEKLDTNYLKYALTAFVEKIKSLAIGAAYSALTIEKLNKYQIAYPSTIEDQQTIVRQLDALRAETQKLEAVYQKKIADLEELKKSILQKAFAGELKTEKADSYAHKYEERIGMAAEPSIDYQKQ